ncbi:MAG: hypothetical protein KTR26_16105, partial [Flammeovirgaceae bacterium]|nr:hypothetical protein [Flammeovirgaceae bacterium]
FLCVFHHFFVPLNPWRGFSLVGHTNLWRFFLQLAFFAKHLVCYTLNFIYSLYNGHVFSNLFANSKIYCKQVTFV